MMGHRLSIGAWLSVVLCAVAAVSMALALVLHDRGLRTDLSQVTRENLTKSEVMTEYMLRQHLQGALRRYRASAQTPELRANLEVRHEPTLRAYADHLAEQHGALALAFIRSGGLVATAGEEAVLQAALARVGELSQDGGSCSRAGGIVCEAMQEVGLAFALRRDRQLLAVSEIWLGSGQRDQGRLLAVEVVGPETLADWSVLTGSRVSTDETDSLEPWDLARDVGGGTLRVAVSGHAERKALANARRHLLTSGVVALLLAIAASPLLARALVRPIQRIGEASRSIHSGDLAVRLRSTRRDEIGDVARAFDAMLDRIQDVLEMLARAQRLAELGSWRLDLDSGSIECSDELQRICALSTRRLDLAGLLETCVHPEDRARVGQALELCVRDGIPFRLDHRTLGNDDSSRIVRTHAERISIDGVPIRVEGTTQDVTERHLVDQQLRYLAEHDALTGLGNRRLFSEQLTVALARARIEDGHLAVLMLGIDDFKVINDTLGPSWGDRALEQIAHRLAQIATRHLSLTRIGDEFTVLAAEISSPAEAARIARQMLQVLREPLELDGHELIISASAGIALWPNDGTDPETLLRSAGAALHEAKQRGRGNHQFYDDSLNALAFKRLVLEKSLRRAVERGEFELHYQPVVALSTGLVSGVEALLRWRDPELGPVPPSEFIPVAEETGLIREVGLWVLRTAVEQVARWRGTPLERLHVAINVSAVQLDSPEFSLQVEEVVSGAGIDPSLLKLEVTESLLPADPAATCSLLQRIANLGVQLALDDFGSGFSSLSALHRLPIHTLKLDRSFVTSLPADSRSAQLVGAIVAMARVLCLAVTVEGIETEEQLEIVREFDCDEIQGHLVSAAVPADDLPQVIAEIECDDGKLFGSAARGGAS